jgi:O-antigen/teichoic acid export membrane protein
MTSGQGALDTEAGAGRTLRQRFQSGVFWNAVSMACGQGSTFVGNLVVSNLIGLHPFGQYSLVLGTLLMVSGIAQFATGFTATRYVAEFRANDKARAGRILALCSLLGLCVGLMASVLLAFHSGLVGLPTLQDLFTLTAAFVLFSVVNGLQAGALAGLEEYPSLAWASVAHFACHVAFTFAGALGWGLEGALVALVASSVLRCVVHEWVLRKRLRNHGIELDYRRAREEKRVLARFTVPAAVSGLTAYPAFWIPGLLVAREMGFGEMALLTAALNLRLLAVIPGILVNGVGASIINHQRGTRDASRFRSAFWMNLAVVAGVVAVVTSVIAIAGPWLLHLYGAAFVPAYPVLLALLASALPEVLSSAVYQSAQSQERIWQCLFLVWLPRDVLLVALACALVPGHGAAGVALAYAGAWAFALVAVSLLAWRAGLHVSRERATP